MSGGGAIYDFDLIRFQGPTVAEETGEDVTSTATRILTNDPDRLAIYITNNYPDTVYISTKHITDPQFAFAIGDGIVVSFQVQNDGAIVGSEFWAVCPTGIAGVNILILRRQRRG